MYIKTLQNLIDDYVKNPDTLGEFMDYLWFRNKDKELLKDEPNWKNLPIETQSYLTACMMYVAKRAGINRYEWMINPKFILKKPYFVFKSNGWMKIYQLLNSPNEFRYKNIFVEKEPCRRC